MSTKKNPAPGESEVLEKQVFTGQESENKPPALEGAALTVAAPEEGPVLESLHILADRHRVPTWQAAALAQFMGWAEGKQVTNADYIKALENLKSRRIGGGRME